MTNAQLIERLSQEDPNAQPSVLTYLPDGGAALVAVRGVLEEVEEAGKTTIILEEYE